MIGPEAEATVSTYASCDRTATSPALTAPGSPFRDRFTGRPHHPGTRTRRDFAELTAAPYGGIRGRDRSGNRRDGSGN
ncbi:hypothetical protein [Streptomyces sp. Tu 3180]|uniref:hypothetical protein n=1 Tax=Streptomyces sp. Tu 3180 TaxID=2682611 RepID=UPI001358CE64|nr:hypothetical protein GL259_22565 [Streptomyces sp. Tu 3180]